MLRSLWFTALVCAALGHAQVPRRAPAAAPSAKRVPTTPRLGDDVEAVIRKLAAAGAGEGKREFETTAEYEARRAKATPGGQMVFVVREATTFEYDADAGEMTAKVESGSREFSQGSERCPGVEAKSVLTRRGRYVGKNAFGVSKVITSSDYNEFGVCIDPSSSLKFDAGFMGHGLGTTKFTFAMDRDDARAAKAYLRLALVGTIAAGVVHADTYYHSPTVTEPYETTTRYYYMPLIVTEARVFDSRTGKQVTNFVPEHKVEEVKKELLPRPTSSIPALEPTPKPEAAPAKSPVPPAPQSIKVDGATQQAMILRQPKPVYPPLAKVSRIQGVVRLNVIISKSGEVQNVSVLSGHPLLVPAAMEAVKMWTYKPTLINETPVEVVTTVDVPFAP